MNNEWHLYDMNLYRDRFQNYKVYQIPKAQLIIADVTYNPYGFEVDRNFFNDSINKLLGNYQPDMFQALKYEAKAV